MVSVLPIGAILVMQVTTDPEDDDWDEDAGPSPSPWEFDGSSEDGEWVE
jgi:hypothetical protein